MAAHKTRSGRSSGEGPLAPTIRSAGLPPVGGHDEDRAADVRGEARLHRELRRLTGRCGAAGLLERSVDDVARREGPHDVADLVVRDPPELGVRVPGEVRRADAGEAPDRGPDVGLPGAVGVGDDRAADADAGVAVLGRYANLLSKEVAGWRRRSRRSPARSR